MTLFPNNQINLYGLRKNFKELINLYNLNKLPNKIILSGEKGIGKCTLAYHLINFILSVDEEASYNVEKNLINIDNKSFKLIQNKSNPNFDLIDVNYEKKVLILSKLEI